MFALYRKGNSHFVDGVACEIARVELGDLDQYRADGWVDNIEDIEDEKPAKKEHNKANHR